MKFKVLLFAGLLVFVCNNLSYSQIIVDSHAEIRNVDFNLVNDELIISYDLVNAKPRERFAVSVKIFTDKGKEVGAKTFSGDVGENIAGGYHKKIIWDIAKDIVYLNDNIYVTVEAVNQNPKIIYPTSRVEALFLSTLYPGWGSAKITLRGAHALKGVVGYGCMAGFVYYRNLSELTYHNYEDSTNPQERDELYNLTVQEKQLSRVLMYSAGTVWMIEYFTVLVSKNRSRGKGFKSNIVYMGPAVSPDMGYPLMSFVVRF